MNAAVIIIAVFLTLSYFFPPIPAGMITGCGVVIAIVIWLFMRQTKRTGLTNREAKRKEPGVQKKARAAAEAKARKQEKARKVRKILVALWTLVEVAFWTVVAVFALSAWQPGWFIAWADKIEIGIAGVAIDRGHEAEWTLTTLSGKAYPGRKTTTPLVPPSVFNWRDNKLVIVAGAEGGGYYKLEGACNSWSVTEPWVLACRGRWDHVVAPEEAMSHAKNQTAGSSNRNHGTFSVEFFRGATEGQVALTQGEGADGVPGWLKFSLVKGK